MSSLMPPVPSLTFTAPLLGIREVPPVMTPGSGNAQVTFLQGDAAMQVFLTVQNMRQVTLAHIHLGMPGENGPIVVNLFQNPQGIDAIQPTFLTNQTFTAQNLVGPLAGMSLSSLMTEVLRGNTYVNVHTITHPDGEIRGQLWRG
jgi:hypothetical protein